MTKKPKADPSEKYYATLAKESRKIWSRSSPARKGVLKNSRSLSWTSQMPKHYCSICKREFSYGDMQVDHLIAICRSGQVTDLTSYLKYMVALDVIPSLLQVLCKPCHSKKTKEDIKKKK